MDILHQYGIFHRGESAKMNDTQTNVNRRAFLQCLGALATGIGVMSVLGRESGDDDGADTVTFS
jgi:hypothetical protein